MIWKNIGEILLKRNSTCLNFKVFHSRGLAHKHKTRLERLAMDKHSSLLRTLVNYDHECLMTLGTCYTKGLKTKQHFDRSRSTSRGTRWSRWSRWAEPPSSPSSSSSPTPSSSTPSCQSLSMSGETNRTN